MLRWSPPSKEKPTVESKRFFSPTPDDLRTLVFDYLCHNSYTNAARAYLKDTVVKKPEGNGDDTMAMDVDDGALDPPLDPAVAERLRLAELRRDIRIQILSGNVDEAIRLLEAYFPAVLSSDLHPPSSSTHPSDTFTYRSPQSVDPTHLLLDLNILGFIEATRTIPLPYHPPGSSTPSPSPRQSPLPIALKTSHVREDSEPSEKQQLLLIKAQRLYADAHRLSKPEDRAIYLKELSDVGALLVYPVPEKGPLAHYLSQDRRTEMADQIEGAILYHTRELAASKIELGARYTTVVWNCLHDAQVTFPPHSRWPASLQVRELTSAAASATESSGKKPSEKEPVRIPTFDFAEFMDIK